MADKEPFFIVLVSKTLTGPYSLSEISALVEKRRVGLSDIGYQLHPGEPRRGEWRFVWQILNVAPPEKAKQLAAEEIAAQSVLNDTLPSNLADGQGPSKLSGEVLDKISLEEWIPKAAPPFSDSSTETESEELRKETHKKRSYSPEPERREWRIGATLTVAGLVILFFLKSWFAREAATKTTSPSLSRLPSGDATPLKSGTPLKWATPAAHPSTNSGGAKAQTLPTPRAAEEAPRLTNTEGSRSRGVAAGDEAGGEEEEEKKAQAEIDEKSSKESPSVQNTSEREPEPESKGRDTESETDPAAAQSSEGTATPVEE